MKKLSILVWEFLRTYPVRVTGLGLMLIITVLWGSMIYARVLQHGSRRAVLLMLVMLVLWECDRIVKLQTPVEFVKLDHLYWYLFYIFRGTLPVSFLWLAVAADENILQDKMPAWIRLVFAVNIVFALFILMNDWHGQFFSIFYDTAAGEWKDSMNWGAYLYWTLWFSECFAALVILWRKAEQEHIFRWTMFIPFFLYSMFLYYSIAYNYVEILHRSEVTGVTALFFLLMLEVCLRTGLMPSNRNYRNFFIHSTIPMQLRNADGSVALSVDVPAKIPAETRINTMYLRGGSIVWYENLHVLHERQQRLQLLRNGLQRQQAMLRRRQEIRQKKVQQATQLRLYREIEKIIQEKRTCFQNYRRLLLQEKEESEVVWILHRMNGLATYLKQRCQLFLQSAKDNVLSAGELRSAMERMKSYLLPLQIHVGLVFLSDAKMPAEDALRLFDFFAEFFLSLAVQSQKNCQESYVKVIPEEGKLTIMLEADADVWRWTHRWLTEWQKKQAGVICSRDLGFAKSISYQVSENGKKKMQ